MIVEINDIRWAVFPSETCPDCGVGVGDRHEAGCDVERCSNCAGQRLGCGCETHDPDLSVWIGLWPGEVTGILKGWAMRGTCLVDLNRVVAHQMTLMGRLRR